MIRDSTQCYWLSGRKKGHKPNEINDLLDLFLIEQICQNIKELSSVNNWMFGKYFQPQS